MLQNIDNYLKNKSVILYSLIYAFAIYLFFVAKNFHMAQDMGPLLNAMYLVDFGVHELSHMVVFFLPPIFVASAGAVGQILYVLTTIAVAIYKKVYFVAVLAGVWIVMTLQSVGQYIADASTQAIPLASISPNAKHDFNFVLGELNMLDKDKLIGGIVANIGVVIGIISLICGGLLILRLIYLRLSHRSML